MLAFCCVSSSFPQGNNTINNGDKNRIGDNTIQLFIGDKLFVEANQSGDSLTGFKIVSVVSDSSKTLIIEFGLEDFGSHKASVMRIVSPFKNIIQYKAKIKYLSVPDYYQTSVTPLYPHVKMKEIWQNTLESIVLSDFIVSGM